MCGFCVTLLNLPLWAFLPLPLHLTIGTVVLADWSSTPISKSLSMCNCMYHSLECNFWVFISAPSFFLHLGYRFSHKHPISGPCLLSHPLLVLVLWYSIFSSYHTCHPKCTYLYNCYHVLPHYCPSPSSLSLVCQLVDVRTMQEGSCHLLLIFLPPPYLYLYMWLNQQSPYLCTAT